MQEKRSFESKNGACAMKNIPHPQKSRSTCPQNYDSRRFQRMKDDYQNRFVKMPLRLYGTREYKYLSPDAKILYAMIRDRQELANRFNDPEPDGRRPVFYPVQEAMKLLNCGNKKAIKVFRELEDIRLITRVRQGQSRPSKIYAKDIL